MSGQQRYWLAVRVIVAGVALVLAVASTAVLAGDGWIATTGSLQSKLIEHDFSSEGVLEFQARNAALSHEREQRATSVGTYRTLLYRDPANAYRWCDFAEALQEAGQADQARRAFAHAVELGPSIPPVLVRSANFDFSTGDVPAALVKYRTTLTLVHDYDAIVFMTYQRMGLTPKQITMTALPPDHETAKNYIQYLLRTGNTESLGSAWSWAQTNHLVDDPIAASYVDFLLDHRYGDRATAALASYRNEQRGDFLRPNRVYNGGFENTLLQCSMDWRLRPLDGVETAIDAGQGATESRCLRIRFSGQTNVAFNHVSQSLWLPAGDYRFQARARADDITTNSGVQFHLSCAGSNSLDWYTEPILGTHAWFTLDKLVAVPGCPRVELEIVRRQSQKFDSKISGTIWIDDVSLTPAQSTRHIAPAPADLPTATATSER